MIISNYANYKPSQSYKAQKCDKPEATFNEALKETQTQSTAAAKGVKICEESVASLIALQSKPRTIPPAQNYVLATREQAETMKAKAEAFAASEAAKKNIPPPNTSLRWFEFEDSKVVFSQIRSMAAGKVVVTIGKDQLPLLMDEIEKALADGKCYTTAIRKLYDSHSHERGTGCQYDLFHLDPFTGQITHALPMGFTIGEDGYIHSQRDDDAVWDLAYDLQQFLKLRVFGETNGMTENEVERLIADIKEGDSINNS